MNRYDFNEKVIARHKKLMREFTEIISSYHHIIYE